MITSARQFPVRYQSRSLGYPAGSVSKLPTWSLTVVRKHESYGYFSAAPTLILLGSIYPR